MMGGVANLQPGGEEPRSIKGGGKMWEGSMEGSLGRPDPEIWGKELVWRRRGYRSNGLKGLKRREEEGMDEKRKNHWHY